MILLIIGLMLFAGVHLSRELGLREAALQRLGLRNYRIFFCLLALAGLALIVVGKAQAPFIQLYTPVYGLRGITHYAMLPAFILLLAGGLPMSFIRRELRHPMLLGTATWGAAHLWANGDAASVILFGGLGLWAMVKFVSLCLTLAPADRPASPLWDVVAVTAGFVVYGVVLVYHGQLFGIGLTLA